MTTADSLVITRDTDRVTRVVRLVEGGAIVAVVTHPGPRRWFVHMARAWGESGASRLGHFPSEAKALDALVAEVA